MNNAYYTLPLQLARISQKKEHPKCTLYESVAAMVHLISVTYFGECKHDGTFGCEIWEHDFENIANSQIYREHLMNSIQKTIIKQEQRLTNINVDIQIEQIDYRLFQRRIKSRIILKVFGTMVTTNESFSYTDQFFIGPLSYY
ncbi:MAG: GPW/gp25 family protein [Draconibacterium sp.]|nr:GPW/gp25 family protein [Draconibacterium sp.]